MATTAEFIGNGVQEEIALNRVIKALQEITVHNEYESSDHALEFGENLGHVAQVFVHVVVA